MSKYIDADKLKATIKAQIKERNDWMKDTDRSDRQDQLWSDLNSEDMSILQIITSLQQEQPEVDLEKFTEKIKTFQGRYKYPEIVSIKGAMAFMARLFYQYPNVARQWYDSLPKATMD